MVIGLIVEPPLDVYATTSSTTVPSDGSDFAINDLFFKVAPSDANPYQRATAQFRKDSLDTGQSVGDQSLTGWWVRSELSFHKGAGVNFYEVNEGDDLTVSAGRRSVSSRYLDAEGLDPFTKVGKVTCQRAWSAFSTAVASVNYVSAIDSNLVVLDGTTLKYGNFNGTPTTYAPAATTVRAVTTSPTTMYPLLANGKVTSVTTAGVETILYTGFTTTARGIWYVKSRLLINDSDGKWYQLAVNPSAPPQAIAATDVIFSGTDWSATSAVCDTPGPILIANSNRVFAASLDSTGQIPVFSAPVQVAELPPGETIAAIAFHLGFVVLVTGAGVRLGILSDSGQLTYGPLLVERATGTTTPPVTSVSRYQTKVSVVIDNRIYEIDLSEQIGNSLEFAYTGRGVPFSSGSTAAGCATLQITTQIAWANGSLWYSNSSSNALAGYLTTGQHRFGTLEAKRFDSVKVHCDGTSGTIEVDKVTPEGSATSLYTIDVSVTHVEDIDLRMPDSTESVGLKFTLTPDPGAPAVSPVLLGYQLRALPDPVRQRMIRVPLLMKDVARRQPARAQGKTGSAWSSLSALEELEASNALVSYRDLRTGETGSAYIESIEFTGATPPTAQSSGFGGTAFVTLRRLS